jgi:UDP-N-acetylglucosamine acyltransferase
MGLNRVGLRRAGFSPAEMRTLRSAYRILFRSGLGLEEALAELEALRGDGAEHVGDIVELVRSSERGIARPR